MANKRYQIAFELAGRLGASFAGAFRSADTHMSRMKSNISKLKMSVRELDREYKKGKISAELYGKMHGQLTNQINKAEQAQRRLNRAMEFQNRVTDFRNNMRGQMLDNIARVTMTAVPVKLAMDFESSMADVRKVVDFETPQQFKEMSDDILEMSKRIPMAANGLADIVAAGGQAGLAREELTRFAEDAAKMGVAFDITADEAGQMMAEWRSAFKMNQDEVAELADKINYLGDTTAASAPKISEVVRRVGPLGEVAGVASGEIAALGASMIGVGVGEEVAATGIQNFMLAMVAGESATKKQKEAFKELSFSAEQMAKRMQTDAKGAILDILKAIRQLDEDKQAAMLEQIFGRESIKAIAPLLTTLENVEENFNKVADASNYAGSMQREFESRSATTANSLQLFKNHLSALGIEIGGLLLPHLNELLSSASDVIGKVQEWSNEHPKLTKVLAIGTTTALGLGVAVTTLGYAASLVATPFTSIVKLLAKMRTYPGLARRSAFETRNWANAQNSLNRSMAIGGTGGVGTVIDANVSGKGKKRALFSRNNKIVAQPLTMDSFPRGGGKGLGRGLRTLGRGASRIPLAGALFSAIDIATASPGEERNRAIGGAVGGAIGGALGSFLGPVGTMVGGTAGYWLGGKASEAINNLIGEMNKALPEIDRFGDEVSESTKEAVGAFLDLNKDATLALNQLSWTGQEVTKELADDVTNNISGMKEQVVSELEKQKDESVSVLQEMFAKSTEITEEEQAEMLKKIEESYEEKISVTTEGENRINEIIKTALEENRSITESEQAEINRIKQDMLETGIQILSENEAEQLAILERMKSQSTEISAQEAAETVAISHEKKLQTIEAAEEEYNERLKYAVQLKADGTAESIEMANNIIAEAERQRDEVVAKAEEIHEQVVAEAQKQAAEHIDTVNWETGEVLTKWELFKNGVQRIWGQIKNSRIGQWITATPSVDSKAIINSYTSPIFKTKKYARGGFITHPHLGLVGEEGPEAIIPLSSNRRSRAMDLWMKTGQMLGVNMHANGGIIGNISNLFNQASSVIDIPEIFGGQPKYEINLVYSPTIQSSNTQEIQRVLQEDKTNLQDLLDDFFHHQRRVEFT